MNRRRRLARSVAAICAAALVVVVASGCAFLKPGSLAVSQPQSVGAVRVHLELCTAGESLLPGAGCGKVGETGQAQYLLGIAVPPGSAAPPSITATPTGSGPAITFTRSDEVVPQISAGSAAMQKVVNELPVENPGEEEEKKLIQSFIGTAWPPAGLEGIGYISGAVTDVKDQTVEWALDADFGLPTSGAGPFVGPFTAAVAFGIRQVLEPGLPASRPVRCLAPTKVEEGPNAEQALCLGTVQQVQLGTSDLEVAAPKKVAQAFVGGSAELAFPLKYGGTGSTVPNFTLSATTTAKGGKAKPGAKNFKPAKPNATTHLSQPGTGKVTVSVPKSVKPGTYKVTLTAKTAQGGVVSGVGKFKVVKAKLKLGALKRDASRGTATLKVKVPGAGTLKVGGGGVVPAKKKAGKAKTLTVNIAAAGPTAAALATNGKASLRVKLTFKPKTGVGVSKTARIVLLAS